MYAARFNPTGTRADAVKTLKAAGLSIYREDAVDDEDITVDGLDVREEAQAKAAVMSALRAHVTFIEVSTYSEEYGS